MNELELYQRAFYLACEENDIDAEEYLEQMRVIMSEEDR